MTAPSIYEIELEPGDCAIVTFLTPNTPLGGHPDDTVVIKHHSSFNQVEVIHEPTNESCNLSYFFTTNRPAPDEPSAP